VIAAAVTVLPAGLLQGLNLERFAAALSQQVAGATNTPLPPGTGSVTHTQSLTCEIGSGHSPLIKLEARATRTASFTSADGQPPAHVNHRVSGGVEGDLGAVSLSDKHSRAIRAQRLVETIVRALGQYDIGAARDQGRELETLVTTAEAGEMPPATLAAALTILCRVEIALVSPEEEGAARHKARARDFLERARDVTYS
jgi:hypothetical protein